MSANGDGVIRGGGVDKNVYETGRWLYNFVNTLKKLNCSF